MSDSDGVTITREQAIEMQDLLIAAYSKESFQKSLHKAYKVAGNDDIAKRKASKELTLPIQTAIIPKFGFAANAKGVQQSVAAFTRELNSDPEIKSRNDWMQILISRDSQIATGNILYSEPEVSKGGLLLPEAVVTSMHVMVEGTDEQVEVHSIFGPKVMHADGSMGYMSWQDRQRSNWSSFERLPSTWKTKNWYERTTSEQGIIIHMAAKKNKRARERWGSPMHSASGPEACLA
mmetsp:Transcript_23033/g.49009  ORF Transcript_23033/g.49009 Transcript_23033/m.49009 type:complete len:235 (+) Transcript_23033:68-772(+)